MDGNNIVIFTESSNFFLDVSHKKNRVQEIRLFAALIEAGWNLKVNNDQFSALKLITDLKKGSIAEKKEIKIDIKVDHSLPSTSVGDISSELIFPEWFFKNFESKKEDIIIFEGLITEHRIKYIVRLLDIGLMRYGLALLIYKISKNYGRVLISKLLSRNKVKVRFSCNGRKKQFKLYDSKYFYNLSENKYVICPPGDFIWTYRLFETVMSKSIPVINHSDNYVKKYGLITKNFDEIKNLDDKEYKKIVEHNFKLIKENISKKTALESLLEKYETKFG